jgi:hypothetical protein
VFGAPPDLRRGAGAPELEDRIKQGNNTGAHRSCNVLSEVSINRFTPLLPCLEQSVQNPQHIVPVWVRGGEPTRDIDNQKKFLTQLGYEYDGRMWLKRECKAVVPNVKG